MIELTIAIAIALLALVVALRAQWKRNSGWFGKQPLTKAQHYQAKDKVSTDVIERLDGKVTELDATIKTLLIQLSSAQKRIEALEEENSFHRMRVWELERRLGIGDSEGDPEELPNHPLLLICGTDSKLCEVDRIALRRANIAMRPLRNATKAMVEAEMRRRRQDRTLYPWVHVSAHSSPEGIMLADGISDREWWHEQLSGVQVLFLAGCESMAVGDVLAGLVPALLVIYADIENEVAGDFTYSFWRSMLLRRDPMESYRQALQEVPKASEYVDMRRG